VRGELVRGFNPWDTLVTPEAVPDLFRAAGIDGATAELEDREQDMGGPDDWWSIVLGTGFRATVDALDAAERAHVEQVVRARLADARLMRVPVIYAAARRLRE
jgi:hypothetical protein